MKITVGFLSLPLEDDIQHRYTDIKGATPNLYMVALFAGIRMTGESIFLHQIAKLM